MRKFLHYGRAIALPLTISIYFSPACNSSLPPPEIKLIENVDLELHKNDAAKYTPGEYSKFKMDIENLKDTIIQEESKFSWLRNYKPIYNKMKGTMSSGEELLKIVHENRNKKRDEVLIKIKKLEERVKIIDELTLTVNAGISVRKRLTIGILTIDDAKKFYKNSMFDSASEKIEDASAILVNTEKSIIPLLRRYSHNGLIEKWKKYVRDTIEETKNKNITAIIINKAERKLTLFKHGKAVFTFTVGLGKNGYKDKLFSGDGATPEGRYSIIKKLGEGESKYYKALLLDYPNQEDKKEFLKAKKRGLISKMARIGGLIEIHGGGKDSTTYGCIAIENHHMDKLFEMVDIETPVTIVGAISHDNKFNYSLRGLERPL
jgi:hypothetical protein